MVKGKPFLGLGTAGLGAHHDRSRPRDAGGEQSHGASDRPSGGHPALAPQKLSHPPHSPQPLPPNTPNPARPATKTGPGERVGHGTHLQQRGDAWGHPASSINASTLREELRFKSLERARNPPNLQNEQRPTRSAWRFDRTTCTGLGDRLLVALTLAAFGEATGVETA